MTNSELKQRIDNISKEMIAIANDKQAGNITALDTEREGLKQLLKKLEATGTRGERIYTTLKEGTKITTMGLYKITCPLGVYIGSASNLRTRMQDHKVRLNRWTHANSKLQQAFKELGEDQTKFQIELRPLPGMTISELRLKEQELINITSNNFNLTAAQAKA